MTTLTSTLAAKFAAIALGHLTREYPHKLDHVMAGSQDVRGPQSLHPIFYGSFDWHSCVHGYWLLARLIRRYPGLPEAEEIVTLFNRQLTAEKVAVETAYALRPESRGFERPYGWAWLLMLSAELKRHERPWAAHLQPLADAFAGRFREFLPKATYPVRTGTHYSTAFAVALALEYAEAANDADLAELLRTKARAWYFGDRGCQAWEPSQDDFLSPALMEAECMRRVLEPHRFPGWFAGFLPNLLDRKPRTLFEPATVSDRTDGKIAHLDGLNLSRAWCWRSIASALPEGDPARGLAAEAAQRHIEASLPHVAGDYMGEHWLATFALLALDAPRVPAAPPPPSAPDRPEPVRRGGRPPRQNPDAPRRPARRGGR